MKERINQKVKNAGKEDEGERRKLRDRTGTKGRKDKGKMIIGDEKLYRGWRQGRR